MNNEMKQVLARVLGKKKKKRDSGLYRSVKDGDLANPIPLDEFLEGVGGVLRLPPKDPPPAPAPEKSAANRFASLTISKNVLRALIAVGAIAVAALAFSAREEAPKANATLPPELIGRWASTDSRYAGRTMEITAGYVAFKNGDRKDDQTVHQITSVETAAIGDSTMVRISYQEAGGTYQLAFKFAPRPKPAIRFVNQDDLVWHLAAR